ncbi:24587_t:CDS:2, partial [Cetraspora pellucida]
MESHSWIFQNIKNTTCNAVLYTIFIDVDPAVSAAIRDEFPTTKSLYCMFHISQNLFSNLKSCLGNQYNEFIQDFYEMQKSLFEVMFEYKWTQLVNKYNNNKIVTGMSSTSQVESYNAKIKLLIFNTNTTPLRLADVLSTCIREEDIKTEYSLFCVSVLRVNLNDSNLFNNENLITIIAKASLDLVDTKTHSDQSCESFIVTPKFKKDINSSNQFSMNISYFNMLNKDHSDMVQDIKEGFIEECQLY